MPLIDLDVGNVAMTLAIAVHQHCKQLTHACLEMEPPKKLEVVVATEGYIQLKRSIIPSSFIQSVGEECPSRQQEAKN
jgi:hypothetical protein